MIPSVLYASIRDRGMVREYLTETVTDPIEGVWEIPAEDTVVAIISSQTATDRFNIIYLEGADCRVNPGDTIGYLDKTIESDTYRCRVFSTVRHGTLSNIRDCTATFRDKEGTIRIHPNKIRISFRPNSFLPAFWRLINIRMDNRGTELPIGFRRIINSDGQEVNSSPVYL